MKRFLTATLLATTALGTAAMADPLPIKSVETEVKLSSVDANALGYWPEIAADLDQAVTTGLSSQMDEYGDYSVSIEINEISLGGVSELTDDGEFNTINGWVYVNAEDEEFPVEKFEITMNAETGVPFVVPAGSTIVAPGRTDFYDALVTAFAIETIKDVATLDTTWVDDDSNS